LYAEGRSRLAPKTLMSVMPKPTALELFAAFAAQLPLLTRDDLASAVEDLRASPGWRRALAHARLQADAIGLKEGDLGDTPTDPAAQSDAFPIAPVDVVDALTVWQVG
jgi:hypothetical protein